MQQYNFLKRDDPWIILIETFEEVGDDLYES